MVPTLLLVLTTVSLLAWRHILATAQTFPLGDSGLLSIHPGGSHLCRTEGHLLGSPPPCSSESQHNQQMAFRADAWERGEKPVCLLLARVECGGSLMWAQV